MKPIVVLGWAALIMVPVILLCLIFLGMSYHHRGYGLHPLLAGVVGVSVLALGCQLASLIDQLENPHP